MVTFAKRDFQFSKFDDVNRLAFGWAIVSEENGKPYFDLHGDYIPMGPIVKASIDFMKNSRASDDMHDEVKTGEVVFCAPVTDATLVDPQHPTRKGLWIGVQINDDEVYSKTKNGDRRGFSIGGFLDEADYIGKAEKPAHLAQKLRGYIEGGAFTVGGLAGEALHKKNAEHEALIEKGDNKAKRIFRSFRLGFISTVDWPAQEGALISIVKGAPKESVIWLRKGCVFTSEDAGHVHIVDPACFSRYEGDRAWTGSAQVLAKDGLHYHSHDMLSDEDGNIIIGANAGHSHTVDAKRIDPPVPTQESDVTETVSIAASANPFANDDDTDEKDGKKKPKKKPETGDAYKSRSERVPNAETRSEHNPLANESSHALGLLAKDKEIEMPTEKEIELQKSLDQAMETAKRWQQIASLVPSHKTYLGKLSPEGQKAFLAKSDIERANEVKSQIVYESKLTGDIYYSFDDERVVKNAKRADEQETRANENDALAKRATFAKRAGEIMKRAYPGDDDVHTAIVAAIETSIPDEAVRKKAFEALTAGAEALLVKTQHNGSTGLAAKYAGTGNGAGGTQNDQPIEKAKTDLRTAVEAYQKAHNIDRYEIALIQASAADPKVRELYEAVQELSN